MALLLGITPGSAVGDHMGYLGAKLGWPNARPITALPIGLLLQPLNSSIFKNFHSLPYYALVQPAVKGSKRTFYACVSSAVSVRICCSQAEQ